MDLERRAEEFATAAHARAGQVRKYTGEPNVAAHGTSPVVPLFPVTCDCGVELSDLDECAAHECVRPGA